MANEEKQETLEQIEPQESPQKEETQLKSEPREEESPVDNKTDETPSPDTKKETYQFPHQLLLKRIGITEAEADSTTKEYIGDFNDFLKHVKMAKSSAEKKGNEYKLPEVKKNKLIRLSKSVCQSLQDYIEQKQQEKRKIEEAQLEEERQRKYLKERREEEMNKIREEEEKKKKEEKDDTIGFWF